MGTRPKTPPALKLRPPIEPETGLHEAVAQLLARVVRPPAMWNCFPAGNIPLPPQWQAKLVRLGLKRGWPDVLLIHGRAYGIELKRRDGRLSKGRWTRTRRGALRYLAGQQDVFNQLEAAGMEIAVCRSIDDVLAALKAWQIPTLGVR